MLLVTLSFYVTAYQFVSKNWNIVYHFPSEDGILMRFERISFMRIPAIQIKYDIRWQKKKKKSSGVNNFVPPAISRPVWRYTEEPDCFGLHRISAWTYDMEAGDLSKTFTGYLNTFENQCLWKNAKGYVELIHSKWQDFSYINILLLQKLFIKENGNIQNILRIKHAILTLEDLIKEALLMNNYRTSFKHVKFMELNSRKNMQRATHNK